MARTRKKSTWIWVAVIAVVGYFTRNMWMPKLKGMMTKTDAPAS